MSKLNIALLVGDIRDVYSNSITKGALRAARENDCNLCVVPGRYYHVNRNILIDQYEYQFLTLFSYFYDNNIDLIIACPDVVGMINTPGLRNSFSTFKNRTGDIPIVTVSGNEEGIPNICYDNKSGFRDGINFLINNQQCKKIAMVAGTEGNKDSNERLEAYRNALNENGIEYDERLVVHGDFTEKCVPAIVNLFRINRGIDAVVFANDRMAIGGYEAMRQLGLRVGIDVAFLGFDNDEKGMNLDPPLASVSADPVFLGYQAVFSALEYIKTKEVFNRIIPTKFVLRDSALHNENGVARLTKADFKISYKTDFDTFAKQSFEVIYTPKTNTDNKENLYRAYLFFVLGMEQIYRSPDGENLNLRKIAGCFNKLFECDTNNELDIGRMISIIENVKEAALEETDNKTKKNLLNFSSAYAYRRLTSILCLRESNKNYFLKKMQHEISRISSDMVGFADTIENEYASILSNLPRVGIENSFLFLFKHPIVNNYEDEFIPDDDIYLKAMQMGENFRTIPADEQKMPTSQIFNKAFSYLKKTGHLVMLNIFTRETLYGVLLCEIPYEDFEFYESIIYQTSSAIRILRLLKENEETSIKLKESLENAKKSNKRLDVLSKTDELTGVLNRRGFMNEAMKILDENKGTGVVVGYADIDRMKDINDTYGHEFGDDAIATTARVIKNCLGKKGVMGRIGGDEFALMFIDDSEGADIQLKEAVESEIGRINTFAEKKYKLSVSIGLNHYIVQPDMDINSLLDNADSAMYAIKKAHHEQQHEPQNK